MIWRSLRNGPVFKLAVHPLITVLRLAWSVDPGGTLRAIYWLLVGKRLRGRLALTGIAAQSKEAYETWIRIAERETVEAYLAYHRQTTELSVLVVITNAERRSEETERTLQSVRMAFGPAADIRLSPDASVVPGSFNKQLAISNHWLLLLSSGDVVAPFIRAALERAISDVPTASVVHWNQDQVIGGKRHNPFIKPLFWDPILHAQVDCLSSMCLIRLDTAIKCHDRRKTKDSFDLRHLTSCIAETCGRDDFVHVPLILTHRGHMAGESSAMARPLESIGFPQPKKWPTVTIIIPTRDRLELLSECISSLERTNYPGEWNVLVVDNDSVEPATEAYLNSMVERKTISVAMAPGPFNFSRLNNLAVEQAKSEFVCLLNNDVTVTDPYWLCSLVTVGVGKEVGAVGPMLLYPDGTIQHAAVVIGIGNAAGHIQRGVSPETDIHATWTSVTRQVSAVTAACLLVRRADYLAVGGLDEKKLAVAFNDVDFCLKLQQLGRRNIYVAVTSLIHHESKSRGSDLEAANIDRFSGELACLQQRWNTETYQDPWFSPLFSRASEQCALQF